jgi:hypothetical protein
MIRISCPRCRSILECPDHKGGSKIGCPKCAQRLQVPALPPNKTVVAPVPPASRPTRASPPVPPFPVSPLPPSPERPPVPPPLPALHSFPRNSSSESVGSETGTCAFCQKPMPSDAIQCSSCRNWRRDIHLLIGKHHRFALAQIAVVCVGAIFVIAAIARAKEEVGALGTPSDPTGVVALIATITALAWAVILLPLAGIRRRLQKLTKGLWERPWWTF